MLELEIIGICQQYIIVVKIDLVNNVMEHEPAKMGWSNMTNGELTSCGAYMYI